MARSLQGNYNVGFHDNRPLWFGEMAVYCRMVPSGKFCLHSIPIPAITSSSSNKKFPVRNAQKANGCNCFTALKAFQVPRILPCAKRPLVVSLRIAGDG